MGLFKKKKEDEDIEETEEEEATSTEGQPVGIQIAKLSAKVDGLVDVRKSFSERFSLISEQIGELRGMIMDANKQIQTIEVDSTRTIELVKEVQPDKFSTSIRRLEGNLEAVKASLESKDAIMKDITEDLKKIRKQMSFYRGIEQVQKLSEEIKKDIFSIKRVQAIVEQHSDKTESMFIDLQKRYGDMEGITKSIRQLEDGLGEIKKRLEKNAFELEKKETKAKFEELQKRFNVFSSASKIENLKEIGQRFDESMNKMEGTLSDMQISMQKVTEIETVFQQVDLPKMAIDVKKIGVFEIEQQKNRELMNQIKEDHKYLGQIKPIMDKQNEIQKKIDPVEQAVGGLLNRVMSMEKEKADGKKLHNIEEEQEIQKDSIKKVIQDMEHVNKNMELIEKGKVDIDRIRKLEESLKSKDAVIQELLEYQEDVQNKFRALEGSIQNLAAKAGTSTPRIRVSRKSPPIMANITGNAPFTFKDGTIITDLKGLAKAIASVADEVFSYHVNPSRNDISVWVENSLKQKALAKVMSTKRSRRDLLSIIKVYSKMLS